MTPLDISEQASLETSRAQREALDALNALLGPLDEDALKFDPDDEYRTEVKLRLVVDNTQEDGS